MYFTGPYLRVTTPKTINGIIPQIVDSEQQYSETFLPLSAKKQVDAKNRRLEKNGFRHLKMGVEVVGEVPVQPVKKTRKTKNQ